MPEDSSTSQRALGYSLPGIPYSFEYLKSVNMTDSNLQPVIESVFRNVTAGNDRTIGEIAYDQNYSSLFAQAELPLNHLPLLLPHRMPAPPLNAHDTASNQGNGFNQ